MEQELDVSILQQTSQGIIVDDTDSDDDDEIDEDRQEVLDSLHEGMELLVRSRTMLEYLADPQLCKMLSEKERKTLAKLALSISQYLTDVEATLSSEV